MLLWPSLVSALCPPWAFTMYLLFCGVLPRAQTKANGSSLYVIFLWCFIVMGKSDYTDAMTIGSEPQYLNVWVSSEELVMWSWVLGNGYVIFPTPRHKHPSCSSRICRIHVSQTLIRGVTMDQYSSGPYVVAESQWRMFWFVLANAGLWRTCPGCSRKDRFLCKQTV